VLGNASPSPQGREDANFRKPHGMKKNKKYNLLLLEFIRLYNNLLCISHGIFDLIKFSNSNTRRHPEPRIPPDSRSVQILYRISGMLNESNRSHIGDGTFQNSLHWYKWESSVPGHFCKRD